MKNRTDNIPSGIFYLNKLALILLILLSIFSAWPTGIKSAGIDFYQYWLVPQIISQPEEINIYLKENRIKLANQFYLISKAENVSSRQRFAANYRKHELKLSSSPLLYTMLYPLISGNYERDLMLYRIISIACTVYSLLVLANFLEFNLTKSALLIATCFLLSGPIKSDLQVANVNQLLLSLIVSYFLFQKLPNSPLRELCSGAVLALALLFKPNIILMIFLLALSWLALGKIKKLLLISTGMLIGGLFAIGISSQYFGSITCWLDWINVAKDLFSDQIYPLNMGNLSIAQQLNLYLGAGSSRYFSYLLIVISSLAVWRAAKQNALLLEDRDKLINFEFLISGLGILTNLLISPLVWPHYLILLMPLILTLVNFKLGQCKQTFYQNISIFIVIAFTYVIPDRVLFLNIERIFSFALCMLAMLLLYILTLKKLRVGERT